MGKKEHLRYSDSKQYYCFFWSILIMKINNIYNSMDTKQYKLHKLEEALGDLKDWESTGWRICDDDGLEPTRKEQNNEFTMKQIMERMPKLRTQCHCETKIKYNHIIYHRSNDAFAMVGSECIHRFGDIRKTCPKCHNRHRGHSAYCSECRIRCPRHNVWHSDNAVHPKRIKMPLGKYEGQYIDEITDKQYLLWLSKQAWLREYLKAAIMHSL
jgi:hypothetical protein